MTQPVYADWGIDTGELRFSGAVATGPVVVLSWEGLADRNFTCSFQILRATGGASGSRSVIATLDQTQAEYFDRTVVHGNTYFYWIQVLDNTNTVIHEEGLRSGTLPVIPAS